MTEKRFELREQLNKNIQCDEISDNGEWITYGEIVDLLNELVDKNEQLKQDNTNLHRAMSKDRVNYLKFRDKVFDLLDIKETDTIGAEVLKELRRELIE